MMLVFFAFVRFPLCRFASWNTSATAFESVDQLKPKNADERCITDACSM
jgi:hypothetical protein